MTTANRRLRRSAGRIASLCAVAALVMIIPAGPAAAGGSPAGTFGITPAPAADGQSMAYFSMSLGDGQSATGTAIIHNEGTTSLTLKVSPSTGITAVNGGTAYDGAFRACAGPACWLSGLPAVITLPPGSIERVTFTVRVPPGTAPGQYLAGVSVTPAAKPAPVQVGSNGKAKAQAVIIETVTVGVAVTVGALSALRWQFQIPGVSGTDIGPTARLNIRLDNAGQTFASAKGTASCTAAGKYYSFGAVARTILPHEAALIAVNAPGLPETGSVPCTVQLRYGRNQTVSWTGTVAFPAAAGHRLVHSGPGAYSVVPTSNGVPVWAWILGALLVAVLIAAVLILITHRRRAGHAAA